MKSNSENIYKRRKSNIVNLLKNNLFFQNLASWFISNIPCVVEHNLEKYNTIKKSFFVTSMEQLQGDYLEFGVFTGSSFVFAIKAYKKLKEPGNRNTRFIGFDSFKGFGEVAKEDIHPFYNYDLFSLDIKKKILANIKKHSRGINWEIVEGFFEDTIKGRHPKEFGISATRIVFIDCDLKGPSKIALNFIKPAMQKGMVLLMDDFFSFKGDLNLGVCGAFNEFCKENPNIKWRELYKFGLNGIEYIVSEL